MAEDTWESVSLENEIKAINKLPETDPSKYALLTSAYARQSTESHEKASKYLRQVAAGRSFPFITPDQPAFSQESEQGRQVNATTLANRQGKKEDTNPNPWEPVDPASLPKNPNPWVPVDVQGLGDRVSEGKSVRSEGIPEGKKPFHPGQILDWVMNPVDPELKTDLFGQRPKETVDDTKPFHPGQMIGHIGDAIRGGVYDFTTGFVDAALTPAAYLTTPRIGTDWGVRRPPVDITPPTTPTPISQFELEALVKGRKDYPESVGLPDRPPTGPSVTPTGNTLVTPNLTPGDHTISIRGNIARSSTGQMMRAMDPGLRPGEYGQDEQLSMLGGHNMLGDAPHLTGKYILTPEEQMSQGMLPLREQRLFKPAPSAANQAMSKDLAAELREPSISPDLESGTYWDPVTLSEVPKRWDIWRGVRTKEEQALLDTIASEDPRLSQHGIPVEGHYRLDNKAFSMNDPIETIPGTSRTAHAGVQVDERFSLPEKIVLPTGEVKYLSGQVRATGAVTDVMRKAGTAGRMMADMIDNAYETASIQFGSSENRLMAALAEMPGKRTWLARKVEGVKAFRTKDGEGIRGDPTRRSLVRETDFSQTESDQIFDYMYTGGKTPASERVKKGADDLYRELHALSSDPAFREIEYKDALTGNMVKAGVPSLHMPQIPRNAITSKAISDTHWKVLYARAGGEETGKSLEQFKNDIVAISRGDNEAGTYQLHNWTRMLDLTSLGGSPAEWARKLGYESDPLVATLRAVRSGYLRGQLKVISQPINDLLGTVPSEAADTKNWLDKAAHAALLEPHWTPTTDMARRNIQKAMQVINIGSLQMSGMMNYGQIIYPVARAGMLNSTKAFYNLFTEAEKRALMHDAGVLVPNMLTKLHNTQGAMAVYASILQHSYGTSMADRHIRVVSGLIGDAMIEGMEKSFLHPPTNPVSRFFSTSQNALKHNIEELGGDPKQILLEGKIPETMRLKMIQRFANQSAGVSDVRGVPLVLLNDNPWVKFRNMYQTYAGANLAETRRLIENAPNKRVAARRIITLLMGATVVGSAENLVMHGMEDALMDDPTPWDVGGRFVMESTAMGLFSIPAMIGVSALRDPGHAAMNAIAGVPGGYFNGILQDMFYTMKNGIGWGSVEHTIRKTPLGKVLGPPVKDKANKERKLRQLQQQERQEE